MWSIRPVMAVARRRVEREPGGSSVELESGVLAIQQSYGCLPARADLDYAAFDFGTHTVTALGWTST